MKPFFLDKFPENSTKRFLTQPDGHMTNEEMLRSTRRHTLRGIFLVMRTVVNYRKGQKQLKNYFPSKEYRTPIYNRAYAEELSTASLGNPEGVIKPGSLLEFVQPYKKFWKSRKVLLKSIFRQFSPKNP